MTKSNWTKSSCDKKVIVIKIIVTKNCLTKSNCDKK